MDENTWNAISSRMVLESDEKESKAVETGVKLGLFIFVALPIAFWVLVILITLTV